MPLPKVSTVVSDDDCDILYESITSSNNHCKCKLLGSEYANYVGEELDLFLKLQSGPIHYSADTELETLSQKTIDLEDETLGTDCEKDSYNPIECEILWMKSANSPDLSTDQPLKEFDDNKVQKSQPEEMVPENCGLSNDHKQELDSDSLPLSTRIAVSPYWEPDKKEIPRRVASDDQSKISDHNCRVCGISLESMDDLKTHLLDHMNDTKSTARIYNESVVALQQLDYPVKSSRLRKRHMCMICKKLFLKRSKMYRHTMVSHSEGRPWRCSLCPKNYTRRDHLRRHELTHWE